MDNVYDNFDLTPFWWKVRPDLRPYAVQALLKEASLRVPLLEALKGSNLRVRTQAKREHLEAALEYAVADKW